MSLRCVGSQLLQKMFVSPLLCILQHSPLATGNGFMHDGHMDGGFSIWEHPRCTKSVTLPLDWRRQADKNDNSPHFVQQAPNSHHVRPYCLKRRRARNKRKSPSKRGAAKRLPPLRQRPPPLHRHRERHGQPGNLPRMKPFFKLSLK